MNLAELKTILEATGYPVAYSHFVQSDNSGFPETPFICYLIAYSSHFSADNQTYKQIENVQIELYTDKKDLVAENTLETILNQYEIPFATSETFIDSEQLFQKIYEVGLI